MTFSSKNGMYTKTENAVSGKDIYQKDGESSGSYLFFSSAWGGWIFGDDTSSTSTGVRGSEVRDNLKLNINFVSGCYSTATQDVKCPYEVTGWLYFSASGWAADSGAAVTCEDGKYLTLFIFNIDIKCKYG